MKDMFVWGVVFCGCVSEWFWGCLANGFVSWHKLVQVTQAGLAFLPFPFLLGRHGNGRTLGWFGEG